METILRPRDWQQVRDEYSFRAPYNYAVLDDFLTDDAYFAIRTALLNDGGWRQKNWQVEQLFNKEPPVPSRDRLVAELKGNLDPIASGLFLVKHWAVVCHKNQGLHIHADNAAIALNIWLSPDECNLDGESGGLILYRLKRTPEMQVHEFNAMPWAGEYATRMQSPTLARIGYRNNRAILFDAAIFHGSEDIRFRTDSFATLRLGLTFALDDPQAYSQRMSVYKMETAE